MKSEMKLKMNFKMNFKKFIGLLIVLVVIGGAISLFTLRDRSSTSTSNSNSTSTSNNAASTALTPAQSITHGHGLAVDVLDPNKLYIATHHGLLVLIQDKDLYQVGTSGDDFMGFSAHPTDANMFFSSGHPRTGGNIGFQKSEDGGFTWVKVSDGENGPVDFHSMAISPVNPNLMFGWFEESLQRSNDQGANWQIVSSELSPINIVADSQDENVVYASSSQGQGVMVSRDKGESWSPLSAELTGDAVSVIAVHLKDSNILFAFSEKLGGLGKSIDAGKTWTKIDESFNQELILHIALSKIDPNIVYALTAENKVYKSTDTGETWMLIR